MPPGEALADRRATPAPGDPAVDGSRADQALGWRSQLLLWSSIAAVPATQTCLAHWLTGTWLAGAEPPPWWRIFFYHLPLWWFWMAMTPAIAALARRFPIDRRGGLMALAVHLPASLLALVLHLALESLWASIIVPSMAVDGPFQQQLMDGARSPMALLHLLAYWALLAVVSARDVSRRLLSRELENSQLRFRLTQARIRALKAQLQPHFMFNALNAVSTLVLRKDGGSALRMLDQLAELVRQTLRDSADEIRLGDDLSLAENYLAIERVRFQDRLRVKIEIDPEVRDALVPHLLLQPVVENAIRHGISPKAKGGTIEVHARRHGDRVRIEVSDDGVGLTDARQPFQRRADGGVGLSNTRDRLRQLYGNDFLLELKGLEAHGTRVTFDLPLKIAEEAAEEDAGKIAGDKSSEPGPSMTAEAFAETPAHGTSVHGARGTMTHGASAQGARPAALAPMPWRYLVLLWSVPGLLLGLQASFFAIDSEPTWHILLRSIPLWWPWILLTPCVLWLARRFPLFDQPKIRAWLAHLAAALAAIGLHAAALLTWSSTLPQSADPGAQQAWSWASYFALLAEPIIAISLSSYLLIVCGHRVLTLAHALRARELQEIRLLGRLAEAEIRSLRMQLRPDLLSDSFEAISKLIRERKFDDAESAIGRLAGELRETLRHGDDLPEVWSSPNLEQARRP